MEEEGTKQRNIVLSRLEDTAELVARRLEEEKT